MVRAKRLHSVVVIFLILCDIARPHHVVTHPIKVGTRLEARQPAAISKLEFGLHPRQFRGCEGRHRETPVLMYEEGAEFKTGIVAHQFHRFAMWLE
ncbi:hypothetical protein FB45DRAFT_926613 [Roridomyces roridus]|uniref:Secreted protein n=1 Tax=Roridomyces roridus TaxID=1738132 RepID=A0AAD7BKH3_9AGAR|nr:hypothetical protein FB45DRAFT_926613 [Roridomyces roridus]